jgi:hypothetical protein
MNLCTARHPLTKIAVKKAGCKRLTGVAAGGINRTFLTDMRSGCGSNPPGDALFVNADAETTSQEAATA